MSLIIDLTPSEEAQISAAARETGLAPAEFVKKLVKEHCSGTGPNGEAELDAMLRKWQEQDSVKLGPDVPTVKLFADWAEADLRMTEEERESEDRLWEDLEKTFSERSRELDLRRLS